MNPEKKPSGEYEQLEINFEPPNEDVLESCRETSEELDEARKRELIEKGVDQGVGSYYDCERRIFPNKSRKPSPHDRQPDPWPSEEQVARNAAGAAAVREVVRARIPLSPAKARAWDEKRQNQLRNPYR